jgi:hypothetical protein
LRATDQAEAAHCSSLHQARNGKGGLAPNRWIRKANESIDAGQQSSADSGKTMTPDLPLPSGLKATSTRLSSYLRRAEIVEPLSESLVTPSAPYAE